jgi:hypothetical protein
MANIYITEYASLAPGMFGPTQAPQEPTLAAYSFATSGSSATSGVIFNSKTALIEVHVDGSCCIALGVSPTAVLGQRRMAANQTKYLAVPQGAGYTIAGITSS